MGHGGMGEMPGMGHGGMGEMPGMGDGGMSGMDGMLSPAEMDALKSAQRVEASKLFLTGMIAITQGQSPWLRTRSRTGSSLTPCLMAKSIVENSSRRSTR